MRTLVPFAIAFGLLDVSLCLCQGIKKSETAPPGTTGPLQIHQLFFERVVRQQVFFERVADSNPRRPSTFQSNLTDGEVAIVNKVAADCDSKLQLLSDSPVVLEARMRFLESGKEQQDWMSQRLTELKARRDRVIVEHVEALRASLGAPRFQALENFIQDWYNSLIRTPATGTGAPAKPVPKK
jgi:hypothetical protein